MHALDVGSFFGRAMAGSGAALLTWLVAADYGAAAFRWLAPGARRLAGAVFGAALGYALLGGAVALLGLVGAIGRPTLFGLLLVALAARLPVYVRSLNSIAPLARRIGVRFALAEWPTKLAVAVAVFALATAFVAAALPAVWWDPIAYHLPIAAAALEHGRFVFDARMVQSGFPLLGEAAALPAYAIAGSAGAAMVTLGAGVVLTLLCAVWAERLVTRAGTLAAALVGSSALMLWLAPSFYVDVPFAMFAVAAIAIPSMFEIAPDSSFGLGLASGCLAGAAASTKYTGLAVALVALASLAWLRPSRRSRLLGFAAGLLCMAGGWYVRAFVQTGDPVYPLLTAQLGSSEAAREFAQRYALMTRHWCGKGAGAIDALTLPWRILVEPRQFCGDPGYALRLGVVFFALALALVRRAIPLVAACLALTTFWFFSSQQWRFLMPALCLYAVVVAVGATTASGRLRRPAWVALLLLGAATAAIDWLPSGATDASNSLAPAYAYIAGRESAPAYLSRRLESYDAALWLHSHARPMDGIVALDDVRDYYFGGSVVWANPYYQSVWRADWRVAPRTRYDAFASSGYRYMVVNANPAYVRRTPTGIDWEVLAADERSGRLRRVFAANDVAVYDLKPGR